MWGLGGAASSNALLGHHPFAAAQDFPHGCGVSSKSACLANFLIIENPNFPALVLARELVTLPIFKGAAMRRIALLLIAVAALAIVVVSIIPASGQGNMTMAPGPGPAGKTPAGAVFVTQIPPGYRDWKLISVSHEEGNLHSLGAILGNDVAIKACREGKLPFPDGTIIAALHWRHASSEENNKVFGRSQSFVAGSPTNVQFMIKDSKKYAATGGWGFGHLTGATANLAKRRCSKPAFPATSRPRLATLSSPVTHLHRHSSNRFPGKFDWGAPSRRTRNFA